MFLFSHYTFCAPHYLHMQVVSDWLRIKLGVGFYVHLLILAEGHTSNVGHANAYLLDLLMHLNNAGFSGCLFIPQKWGCRI